MFLLFLIFCWLILCYCLDLAFWSITKRLYLLLSDVIVHVIPSRNNFVACYFLFFNVQLMSFTHVATCQFVIIIIIIINYDIMT